MKSKKYSIPVAMLSKNFYCHKCGEKLERNPKTRTVKRGDKDYRKHSTYVHNHMIGDVELTEYDFICPSCGKIISFDQQCVIEKIQKRLKKRVLSKTEISENEEKANKSLKRKKIISNLVVYSIFILITVLVLILAFNLGGFSFKFYL